MPVNLKQILDDSRVVDLKGTTKEQVLAELVEVLATSPLITNREELHEKIFERERTLSTGVGIGVALPHVKIPGARDFVMAVGRSFAGVDFKSLDDKPAHVVVMIACNDSQSGEFLKVMARLVMRLKDKDFRKQIQFAKNPREVVDLFTGPGGALA